MANTWQAASADQSHIDNVLAVAQFIADKLGDAAFTADARKTYDAILGKLSSDDDKKRAEKEFIENLYHYRDTCGAFAGQTSATMKTMASIIAGDVYDAVNAEGDVAHKLADIARTYDDALANFESQAYTRPQRAAAHEAFNYVMQAELDKLQERHGFSEKWKEKKGQLASSMGAVGKMLNKNRIEKYVGLRTPERAGESSPLAEKLGNTSTQMGLAAAGLAIGAGIVAATGSKEKDPETGMAQKWTFARVTSTVLLLASAAALGYTALKGKGNSWESRVTSVLPSGARNWAR